MAFAAFLDTNVLLPITLADTLLTQAESETFSPLWSAGVLEELARNLAEVADLTDEQIQHRITEMQGAFLDAEVTGY